MVKKFLEKNSGYFYVLFRVIIGLVFLLHGVMKIPMLSSFGLMTLAGVIELVGGALLILGLFVRPVALVAAIEMVFAYFMAHAGNGWNPLVNKGEPAVLFFAAFLVLIAYGHGKCALANLKRK